MKNLTVQEFLNKYTNEYSIMGGNEHRDQLRKDLLSIVEKVMPSEYEIEKYAKKLFKGEKHNPCYQFSLNSYIAGGKRQKQQTLKNLKR